MALTVSFLPIIPILVLMVLFSMFLPSLPTEMTLNVITLLATLPFYPIFIATIVRRMHDLNWSGWWIVLVFLELLVFAIGDAIFENTGTFFWWMWVFVPPLLGCHIVIICGYFALLFREGTKGVNDYGINPLNS